jgi:intracellular multiplication protein IcmE
MTDLPPDDGLDAIGEENFDGFEGKKNTLGSLWRDSAPFKIGVVVCAAALIFGAITLFGGSAAPPPDQSYVPEGSTITAAPGTEEASPAYIDAVKEQNEARTEEAMREGTSALPTPIEPPVGVLSVPGDTGGSEDPLQRWRRLQEERLQKEIQQTQALAPESTEAIVATDANREAAIQQMSQAMMTQMQSILQTKNQVKVSQKKINDIGWLENLKKKEEAQVAAAAAANAPAAEEKIENILIPAGQIHYAQLINEANSDIPGPILAQVLSGPLSGSRLIGEFTKEKEVLTMTFSTAVLKGISYNIDAIALDPNTTLSGLATDVDHHYFKRIALPAAAAFVEGMAGAISESGLTTVTVQGETVASETEEASNDQEVSAGIEEAGSELSEIINDIADETEVTVIVARGTPMAILFLEPVIESESTQATVGTTNQAIADAEQQQSILDSINLNTAAEEAGITNGQ